MGIIPCEVFSKIVTQRNYGKTEATVSHRIEYNSEDVIKIYFENFYILAAQAEITL